VDLLADALEDGVDGGADLDGGGFLDEG